MNAPFKPPLVEEILADACVSVSTLKKNPAAVIAEARERQVAILNRGRPVAYVISPQVWDHIVDVFDDMKLAREFDERRDELEKAIPVSLDDLLD